MRNKQTKILSLCQAGMIAALYTVLTYLSKLAGLSDGVIQCRFSEALCVLPFFTFSAIPGLTLGCFLSNLLTGCPWQDIVFGSLATLAGALGAYAVRKISPWLVPLPTILSNALVIPFVLAWVYGAEEGIPFLMLTVGAGEILSVAGLGLPLLFTLRRYGNRIFRSR